jgi:hypothetical protein
MQALQPTAQKDLHKALAKRLAKRDISDAVIGAVSQRIVKDGLKIGGVDFCPYGICIDYFSDKRIRIDDLFVNDKFRVVRLFPYGVIADDLFRVQVEMHVPELAEIGFRG